MDNDRMAYDQQLMEKPLEDIQEDIFFRADSFQDEAWYHEFLMYTRIGICLPSPEHITQVQKALKIMGYATRITQYDGTSFLLPENEKAQQAEPPSVAER